MEPNHVWSYSAVKEAAAPSLHTVYTSPGLDNMWRFEHNMNSLACRV